MKPDFNKTTVGYKEIKVRVGDRLENAHNNLVDLERSTGKKYFSNFNGKFIFSDETLDQNFYRICGRTKFEDDEIWRKRNEEYERRQAEHAAKIPDLEKEWIEKGHEILPEEFWARWDEIVPIRLRDLYQGMELGACLDILKAVKRGDSREKIERLFGEQGHSGCSAGLVCSMIREFGQSELADYLWG